MTVARSVADVLADHVIFEVECIDRMYLNVYQPRLQFGRGLVGYVHRHLAQGPTLSDVATSDWRYSLMNWGHDPLKDET